MLSGFWPSQPLMALSLLMPPEGLLCVWFLLWLVSFVRGHPFCH